MATTTTFEKRVSASLDDVEQRPTGSVYTGSSDLELVDDVESSLVGQTIGLRFTGINVPAGATITKAYIQFQAKEAWTGATSVLIHGQNSANAAAFANTTNNVSLRPQTAASVAWTIAPWNTVGAAGLDQRTPDLTSIVQQIADTSGWSALNSMAFIITGSGTRTAWAYDGNAAAAPLLHIEYTLNTTPEVGDISINDVSISEGDSGTKTATFTVSRTGTAAFAVNYATANGTATAGSDYAASSGTLNFAQGQTTQTVSVTINGDTLVEPTETFFVNLSGATNGGNIVDSQGVGIITNDDGTNHAPIDIALAAPQPVKENVAGAVVGTLSVSDPDPGDTYTFTVSDARFEVVGNQLRLKDGLRLDFEREPKVNLNITATDQGGLSVTKPFTVSVGDVPEVRFAEFSDYGGGDGEPAVANLIASMNVDFIVTAGDNIQNPTPGIDDQVGKSYSSYIGNYTGAYGTGSAINRFFPTVGNHDYEDGGPNGVNYYNYFTLPDNERYYDYQMGPIHFFSLNSTDYEPDGNSSSSTQAKWLQSALAASDSPFNIVLSHYPPYSSGSVHGSDTTMQWPFENWGATAVFSGHDHEYERILRDDNGDGQVMPYFVAGLGGRGRYDFSTPVAGSQVRYSSDYGAMLVQASDSTITFEFWSVANGGQLIDSYTIDRQGADPLLASGDDILNGGPGADYMNGLSGNDRLEGKGGDDMLIGGQGTDTFVFNAGFGKDTIADFTVEGSDHDVIELSTAIFPDWNSVQNAISDSAQGAVITVDSNNTITFTNVTKAQLIANQANDFRFVPGPNDIVAFGGAPALDPTQNAGADIILWRGNNGALIGWGMNGNVIASSGFVTSNGTVVAPDATFSVVGLSDFDGDGNTDVLWRSTSGALIDWTMNGSVITASANITSNGALVQPDASFSVAGVGDFSGDGKSDILWRGTSGALVDWTMDGAVTTASANVTFNGAAVQPDASFSVAGIGDFDGDGKRDILWRSTSGTLIDWTMNGSVISSSANITSNGALVQPDASFSIAGVGDFNGDGKSDVLWRNTSGSLVEWLMDGNTIGSSANITTGGVAVAPDATWHVVEIGDFNGDGNSDILWRNDNGSLAEWLMNGTAISQSLTPTSNGAPVSPDATFTTQAKPTNFG